MPINYLNAPMLKVDTSLYEDLFGNMLKSYQGGQKHKLEQEQGKQKLSEQEMKNALLKEFGRPREQAEIDYLKNKALTEAFGPQLAQADIALKGAHTRAYDEGSGNRLGITPSQRIWNSLPSANKQDMIATAVGLGFTPDEAAIAFSSGKTLKDLAESAGKDLSQTEKVYAPTTANITGQKNQEGGAAELDVLEKYTATAMAPYSRTFNGFSPKQIVEAISGENEDAQAQYLASRALQPEIAGARARIAGGSNASEALREMQEKAFGQSKVFQSLVSPSVFEKTQHYINKWLKDGNKARRNTIYNIKDANNLENESATHESSDIVTMKKGGRKFAVPRESIREALLQGATYE